MPGTWTLTCFDWPLNVTGEHPNYTEQTRGSSIIIVKSDAQIAVLSVSVDFSKSLSTMIAFQGLSSSAVTIRLATEEWTLFSVKCHKIPCKTSTWNVRKFSSVWAHAKSSILGILKCLLSVCAWREHFFIFPPPFNCSGDPWPDLVSGSWKR